MQAQTQAGAFVKAGNIVTFGNNRHKRLVWKTENLGLRLAGNVGIHLKRNHNEEI